MSYLSEQKTPLRAAQVAEALLRMKLLGIREDAIRDFREFGQLYRSERDSLLDLDYDEWYMVEEFERRNINLVYHVIKTNTTIGPMWTFLYVGDNPEIWEADRKELEKGKDFAMIRNDAWDCVEFATIEIEVVGGCVRRIA